MQTSVAAPGYRARVASPDRAPLFWRGIDLTQHTDGCDGTCNTAIYRVPVCRRAYAKAMVKGLPLVSPRVVEKVARLLRPYA